MPSTDNERAAIPLYKDDIQTAREKGELDIALLSYQTNVACAKDIDKDRLDSCECYEHSQK